MEKWPLVRRSALIMPANRHDFVEKAWRRGADAIVLDLEDSIIAERKAEARASVKEALTVAGLGGSDVLVRVNPGQDELMRDLEASVYPGLHGVIVPKIEAADEVEQIEAALAALEKSRGMPGGSVQIGLLVETAKGFMRMSEIAAAGRRAATLNLGTEDFTLDLGMESGNGSELAYPKLQTVIAARAAGLQPLGLIGSMADYKDLSALRLNARESYRYGFQGSSCIHPDQVAVLNEAFSPTAEQVELAHKVVQVYERSAQEGRGTASLDGKMIDLPVAVRAYKVIERQQAIEHMEARKQAAMEKRRKDLCM